MATRVAAAAREEWQSRVSKGVWGMLCITMGALFTLDNFGRIDMSGPSAFPASHAVDGDPGTRWSSAFRDPQWIAVDLGAPAAITRVKLNWEAAFATEYRIEVSEDGSRWTTVREVTGGDGGVDDLEVSAKGRYVRVYGTRRATGYGYSLWELEVYGTPGSATPVPLPAGLLSQGREATVSSREGRGYWFLYWPLLMIAAGLPALLAPKDGGDQVFGLVLVGLGVFFQLQKLQLVAWSFTQAWPLVLVAAGLVMVIQTLRQVGSRTGGDGAAGSGDEAEGAR